MFTKFLFLIFALTIINMNAAVEDEDSSIDSDAAEWAVLQKEHITRSPYESVRGDRRTRCRIIHECCPQQRSHLFNILSEAKIEQSCTGDKGKSYSFKCQALVKHLSDIRKSTEYTQLAEAYVGYEAINNRFVTHRAQMEKVCSPAELSGFYCEPENTSLFQSCAKKVLRFVDRQNGGNGYKKFFRILKDDYANLLQRITNKFPYLR